MISDSAFRLYDIRGKVPDELQPTEIQSLSMGLAEYFRIKAPLQKTVIIGRDGRIHSPDFRDIIVTTLLNEGYNVVDIGICPTPVLYFMLATRYPSSFGIMITASHNSKEYNGLKICYGTSSICGDELQQIKKLYQQHNKTQIVQDITKGLLTYFDACALYIDWLCNEFKHLKDLSFPCIIDCANGAAATVIPTLIKKLGWVGVRLLCSELDGNYPNHDADPTVPKNMAHVALKLKEKHIPLGVGFDGDADRMAPMLSDGTVIPGDQLLALFAQHLRAEHKKRVVVFDIKCSSGLVEALKACDAIPHMSPSGHSIIKQQLKLTNAVLAGELSCHFFFADRSFGFDDGIYAFLRLAEILITTQKSLSELIALFPKRWNTPEFRLACSPENQKIIIQNVTEWAQQQANFTINALDGIRIDGNDGWVLVRSSNTQPVICIRYEGVTAEALKTLQKETAPLLLPYVAIPLTEY